MVHRQTVSAWKGHPVHSPNGKRNIIVGQTVEILTTTGDHPVGSVGEVTVVRSGEVIVQFTGDANNYTFPFNAVKSATAQ